MEIKELSSSAEQLERTLRKLNAGLFERLSSEKLAIFLVVWISSSPHQLAKHAANPPPAPKGWPQQLVWKLERMATVEELETRKDGHSSWVGNSKGWPQQLG